jgi:two-component system cell cycle sensor histidine kinase/response regulator CckA
VAAVDNLFWILVPVALGAGFLLGLAVAVLRRRPQPSSEPSAEEHRDHDRFRRRVMQATPDVVYVFDLVNQRVVYSNRPFEEHLGYTPEQIQAMAADPRGHLVHPNDLARAPALLARWETAADSDILESEYRLQDARGEWRWFVARSSVFRRDAAGRVRQLIGIATDVSARKRAEEALRQSEERYRVFLAQASEGIWRFEPERPIPVTLPPDKQIELFLNTAFLAECNDAMARMYGFAEAAELVGKRTSELLVGSDPQNWDSLRAFIASGYRLTDVESHETDRDGKPVIFLNNLVGLIEDGALVRAWGTQRDVTAARRAEEARRESEARFRDLFESSPDAIFVKALDGTVLDVNPEGCRLHGLERGDLVGRNGLDLVPPEQRGEVEQTFQRLAQGELTCVEGVSQTRDGRAIPVELRASRLTYSGQPALLLHVRDLTERRRLEEQLRQAHKMEAVGRLAGGVAHDFNNLLCAINGYASVLLRDLPSDHAMRADLEQIQQAGERATALTRQLLAFGRKQMLQPVVLDLNAVVVRIEQLLRRVIGEDVRLTTQLDPQLPRIKADPTQVEQVLLNLAVNARDAMPEGGTLTIRTGLTVMNGERPELRPGKHALLAVSDTGCGMDAETRARVFEPFFTTKEVGQGTGLGLATVYGIVRQSGGTIDVESEPGRGTLFTIYLPCADDSPAPAAPPLPAVTARGGEVVLLVEDQPEVRQVARRMLQLQGYQVLEARDGPEALEVQTRHVGPIDILITDVIMPGMSGRHLAEQLTALRPGLPVLFLSGHTGDAVLSRGVREESVAFLAKPFSADDLARKVREVLDSAGRQS